MTIEPKNIELLECYHCGEDCNDGSLKSDEKIFCCTGCKTVYEILQENNLCNYYTLENTPGISLKILSEKRYEYLDDPSVVKQLTDFYEANLAFVSFDIPQIHCSSCIWLLENLYQLNNSILNSSVDFLKKRVSIKFIPAKITLKQIVMLLASLGYEPRIHLDSAAKKKDEHPNKSLYYKIGIAAFCFGNIMLLSFPEYLSLDFNDIFYKKLFGCLNFILSLPVFFYSASGYYSSAIKGLRKKVINIDVPISLGILTLFIRSSYEILAQSGAGYFDSLTGLVFFLLIGKLFQSKTYEALNFERDYKAYFPLSVILKTKEGEHSIPISKLKVGDRILIRSNEIIPADSILFGGFANIDYSFVTGESKHVQKVPGEVIYAGGRQSGGLIELEVIKEVSQSYLTQLWNSNAFNKKGESNFTHFSNAVSKYFTIIVLLIAFISAIAWIPSGAHTALSVFTAVLIIACPCALALSTPFTLGNTVRIFGRNRFYLKNIKTVEDIARANAIVFDKTGTITKTENSDIKFLGQALTDSELDVVKSLVKNSTHPISRQIHDSIQAKDNYTVNQFEEKPGRGIRGVIDGRKIKLGTLGFVNLNGNDKRFNDHSSAQKDKFDTRVYLSIDDKISGVFELSNSYREGIKGVISELSKEYDLSLLSGDNDGERNNLLQFFSEESKLYFKQSPEDKLKFIESLQGNGKKVIMLGDGLNDAGALKQSDAGIAVTESISSFSPASDAILDASLLSELPLFIKFSKTSVKIIYLSFVISFFYNVIGLSFAVQALLTPIIAAILMPLSSISVVAFATLSTNLLARKRGL